MFDSHFIFGDKPLICSCGAASVVDTGLAYLATALGGKHIFIVLRCPPDMCYKYLITKCTQPRKPIYLAFCFTTTQI